MKLVDAGNTTPEAALESAWWATAQGDYDAVISSYIPQMRTEVEIWNGDKAKFTTNMKHRFSSFKGLQIVACKTIAADNVELRFYFQFQNSRSGHADHVMSMVKIQGVWKCAKQTDYTTSWDEGSQPEQ